MENDKPIFWYHGLFLQPQHFQLSDLYQQSLLTPYRRYAQPYFWGIGKLKVDQSALNNRSLMIEEGEFLFPDGAYLVYPGNAVIQSRSLEGAQVAPGKPLKVFLGIKRLDQLAGNVTLVAGPREAGNVTTRFISTVDPEEVKDLYHDGPPAQVKKLNYVARFFFENEKKDLSDYFLVPVAQLVVETDKVVVSRNFIPPCINISAPDALVRIIKDITDKVIARCRMLEEYKIPGEMRSAEFDIGSSFLIMALSALNRHAPLLLHLMETPSVHPWALYGELAQLAGELSTYSKAATATREQKTGMLTIPPYNHEDLWTCFSTLQSLIGRLLDEITVGPESIIQLTFKDPYYVGKIAPNLLSDTNQYYLVISTKSDQKTVIDSVLRVAKLSAGENLPALIQRALPGIELRYSPVPPAGMRRKADSVCFQVVTSSQQWDDVKRFQNIGMYWDNAPKDITAEILIVRRY